MQPPPRSDDMDRLSAEYALGTMPQRARRRFEAWMARDQQVARAAARWHQRLLPLALRLRPVPPPAALWPRIEARLFVPQVDGAQAAGTDRGLTRRGWLRWLAPLPAGMLGAGLTAGLAVGLVGPALWRGSAGVADEADGSQLPQSYVGVLAAADGKPGLIVSSLRQGRVVDLKRVGPAPTAAGGPAAGRTLVLWWIGTDGAPHAVAPIPDAPDASFSSVALARTSEQVFSKAVELAVSQEAPGFSTGPAARPTLPYVYRGLCGKLWPPPRAAASKPAS